MADRNDDEYQNVDFYAKHTKAKDNGFSKFEVGKDLYFCRYIDGEIAMLSQAYTSVAGRDNGIESVKKNEKIAKRFRFGTRAGGKHGFSLKAGNGQEIAISPDYASLARAQHVTGRMSGSVTRTSAAKPKAAKPKAAKPRTTTPKAKTSAKPRTTAYTSVGGSVDNYKRLSFYENYGGKAEGFNSFERNGAYYFHYNRNGKVVLISEGYASRRARDTGLASVQKNMKLASAYQYRQHKNGKFYFDIHAANGREIATSRWYRSRTLASGAAGSISSGTPLAAGKPKAAAKPRTRTRTTTRATTRPKAATKTRAAARPKTTKAKTTKRNVEQNYMPVAAYRKATKGKQDGFESFKGEDGEYYFTYFENGKIALISEGYPTTAARDTGLASVQKNMKIAKRYVYGKGADGKDGFILRAGNHKEIARSVGYASAAAASTGAAYLIGTRKRANVKRVTTAKPVTRRVSAAKPKPVRKKTVKAKAPTVKAAPKPSAKAKPVKSAPVKKKAVAVKAPTAPKPKPKLKPAKKKTKVVKPLAAGAVAATGLAASAKAKPVKRTPVKKKAVTVKAPTAAKPKPKPKPVKKTTKVVKPLAAGAVAVAGLGAAAASAKASSVKKKAVPVKAPPMKPASVAKPAKAAPAAAAAAIGTAAAAAAGASAMAAKPKVDVVKPAPVKAPPVKPAAPVVTAPVTAPPVVAAKAATVAAPPVAAAKAAAVAATAPAAAVAAKAPAAAVAASTGGGIWGWLKWLLLALLALLAMFFLFKGCAGEKAVKTTPPVTTTTSPTAALITCWNGDKAKNEEACPAKIECWDNSFVTRQSACPVQPPAKTFECWDGSLEVNAASCPAQPVAKAPVVPTPPVETAPAAPVVETAPAVDGRICGFSPQVLFNVSSSTPKSVSYLGSNPQFGNSLSLTPDGFYRKLLAAYEVSGSDRAFLNTLARSLGYGSFRDMDASMFSNDTLPRGTSGLLGFGSNHALQFSALDVTDPTHLEAFKVRSANGTDVHFMKRCGNYMYVCQP